MRAELDGLREHALADIAACRAETELEAVRVRYLGKKGSLNTILRGLGGLPADERPAIGALANEIKEEVLARIAEKASELGSDRLRRSLAEERIDVTLPGRARPRGHVHPLRAVEREIVGIFVAMGFSVAEGPEIEDDFHNFGALNFPPDHPARDTQDTLFLGLADDALLRTHTSPVQIRTMERRRPPLKMVAIGKVFRRDSDSPAQVDKVVVRRALALIGS